MKERVKEKIFEEIRRKNLAKNQHWDIREYMAFYNNLNPKEKQTFQTVIEELIVEGVFMPTSKPMEALVLTEKGVETIY